MKKILLLFAMAFVAVLAQATDYTEPIVVTINGVSLEQAGIISVTDKGDTYDLTLKNFALSTKDGTTGVGNIEMKNIKVYRDGDVPLLMTTETITLTPGDDPNISIWMASILPPVPVELRGKIEDGHLRCYIDIDMQESLGQIIQVAVGGGYQLRNQSFEDWHTTSSDKYVEPNGWHSFESATGALASLAGHHIEKSEDAHSGEASACVFSTSIFGIVANGTMATGRMNAASATATDTANNAYTDTSLDAVDGNGDPFYTPLYAMPDSIAFWVKFKQGKANSDHPYATMSAIITDGTYYQDPEDKAYDNVIAKAKMNTISETGEQWMRIVAPFDYTSTSQQPLTPKAILVTLSTNADPGQGANNDRLYVDDGELIYNTTLADLKVKGMTVEGFDPARLEYELELNEPLTTDDIEAVTAGRSAHIIKTVDTNDDYYHCLLTVFSGDMASSTTYTVKVKTSATAIQDRRATSSTAATYYTLDGRRVYTLAKGHTYIRRQADGTVSKVRR